jgi:hypothetical protein
MVTHCLINEAINSSVPILWLKLILWQIISKRRILSSEMRHCVACLKFIKVLEEYIAPSSGSKSRLSEQANKVLFGCSFYFFIPEMKIVHSSETTVNFEQTPWNYIPAVFFIITAVRNSNLLLSQIFSLLIIPNYFWIPVLKYKSSHKTKYKQCKM